MAPARAADGADNLHEMDTIHRLVEIFLLEHPHLVGEYDERGAIRAIRRSTTIETPDESARDGS